MRTVKTLWHTRRKLLVKIVLAVSLTVFLVPVALGIITMSALLFPSCGDSSSTPADYGLIWEDVTIKTKSGDSVRAYFIPGTNRAAILIAPSTNNGRGSRLPLAALLAQHGYAVLTFESRRCAGMGALSLGYKEAGDVGDALAYLQTRSDIDPDRIGVTGFSSAGATAILAAARFGDLKAVIAEGGYGDFAEEAVGIGSGDGTLLEIIYKQSLSTTYHLITGIDIDKLSPVDVIADIAPRPILLIYGSDEVSLSGGYRQAAAAGPNAELWVVEKAGHGRYRLVAPVEYETRVVKFFDRALLTKGLDDEQRR
ncbi:MAG: prolyl oligopeptidase family serine peptidase [Chloroflexi bacterium]|nr:prolyl oligopeptidase family serine peptidase [Chloroflexota bacterium]